MHILLPTVYIHLV